MIRPVTALDLPGLERLEQQGLPHPWTLAQIEGELERPIACAVLDEEAGLLRGFALGWSVAGEAELLRITVNPTQRRLGLGRALLRAWLQRAQAEDIFLEVRADNSPAIALYESEGFERVGLRRRYYTDGEDAVLMRLSVGAA